MNRIKMYNLYHPLLDFQKPNKTNYHLNAINLQPVLDFMILAPPLVVNHALQL